MGQLVFHCKHDCAYIHKGAARMTKDKRCLLSFLLSLCLCIRCESCLLYSLYTDQFQPWEYAIIVEVVAAGQLRHNFFMAKLLQANGAFFSCFVNRRPFERLNCLLGRWRLVRLVGKYPMVLHIKSGSESTINQQSCQMKQVVWLLAWAQWLAVVFIEVRCHY